MLRGFAEQTAHYFTRPHEAPASGPVGGPAAWRGETLRVRDDWRTELSPVHRAELERALRHAEGRGKPDAELEAADFPLPTLAPEIARWRVALSSGAGVQLVSGFPVETLAEREAALAFYCLGLHLGMPGAQNPQGDLLGHVTDTGDDSSDPFVRLYRTSADIAYHCDAADVVGLLCLRAARKGGASRIVSSVSVFDELARRRPDLVERLYEPFLLDVRGEDRSGRLRHLPIPPCRYGGGRLRTFYHSDYFRSVVRHDDVPDLTDEELELMNLYEQIASDSELYYDMDLEPGDIQWLSNHSVLHARTAYEDHPEPEQRRHLLRLWLSLE